MVNLHTHTKLCRHAAGLPIDYARQAEKKGISLLGFSDHTPFPDDRMIGIRMYYSQLEGYLQDIRLARESFPDLKILAGLECEYFPELHAWYREELLGERAMDYLIGSVHFYAYRGELRGFWEGFQMDRGALLAYAESYVEMLESGLFSFGAHPDTFGSSTGGWNQDCQDCAERICKAAARLGTPLEINTSGWLKAESQPENPRPYPLPEFWKVAAQCGVKAVVNADAHAPDVLDAYLDNGYRLAQECGVELVWPFGQ